MREAFTFLAAFMEDADEMETVSRGEFYELLVKYALLGQEPDLSSCGVEVRIAFKHAKRMIDDGNAQRDAKTTAGKRGGEATAKQSDSRRAAETKQTDSRPTAKASRRVADEQQNDSRMQQTSSREVADVKQKGSREVAEGQQNAADGYQSKSKSKSKSENESENQSERESENPPFPEEIETTLSSCDPSSGGTGERAQERDGFEEFWDAYPRKDNKVAARREWDVAVSNGRINAGNQAEIVASVKKHIDWDKQWSETKYIPFPASYIRDERWADALKPPAASSDGMVSSSMDDVEAAWEAALKKSYAKLGPVTAKDFE